MGGRSLCVMGVVDEIKGVRRKEIPYRLPVLGGVISGALLIGFILMYTLGMII